MVLFEAKEKKIILGDPANGLIEMKWEEFEKIWTKNIILLKPTENFKETKKYKRNYKYLISLIYQFKKDLIIMGIFTAIISGISAITTQFYSYLLDHIVPENSLGLLVKALMAMTGIFILTVQLNLMKQKFSIKINKKLDKELVVKIYSRITNLPMSFFSSRTNGDISARYHDGDQLRSVITGFSLSFIADFGYAAWAAILVFSLNWQMCVIAIIMEELMILIQAYSRKRMEQQNRELFKSSTELDNFVVESFNASETVKTYTAEKVMENEMQTRFKKFQDKKYQNTLQNEVQNSFVSVISNIGNIFMLGIMGIYVMAGSMTVGELVKAYMYVNYLFQPINYIMGMKKEMIEITSVLERLDDVFNTYTEEEINKNRKNVSDKIRKIE